MADGRDLSTLIEHPNARSTNTSRVARVLATVADMGDLFMYGADESAALRALLPVGICASGIRLSVATWRNDFH